LIVFELTGTESHPVYQQLALENLDRQYGFLQSIVEASLNLDRPMVSIEVIKALNYHAISCLHVSAGEFRPCPVYVGDYTPPMHFQVPALMQMFTNEVNRYWEAMDAVQLATVVLWKLNQIHPFVNGNGRTARVTAYMVLCLRLGGWLPGKKILPERLLENRDEYVEALQAADKGNLKILHAMLGRLLDEQDADAKAEAAAAASKPTTSA
jgi:Fic family protein